MINRFNGSVLQIDAENKFVGLKSKMYAFITEYNKSYKRVKGNDKSVGANIFSETHSLQINC